MRVVTAIRSHFGKAVPIVSLFTAPTIFQLSRLLDANVNNTPVVFSEGLRGHGTGAPLFYIPQIEGYAFFPQNLARHLIEGCRIFDGLEYPGLNDGKPLPTSLEEIAAHLIPQIQKIWPHGPYYLCGWSFGGSMAFEVARQMEAQGVKVQLVLLLDSRCLGFKLRKRSMREIVSLFRRHLSTLSGPERAAFLRELVINKITFSLSAIKRSIGIKPNDHTSPMMVATEQAAGRYRPGSYGGRVVLFQVEDWEFTKGSRFAPDPTFGWGEFVRGGLEIIRIPGNHLSLMNEPAVSRVAERLLDRLKRDGGEQTTAQSRADSQPLFKPA
jgi:thioesterase domain-containing protein